MAEDQGRPGTDLNFFPLMTPIVGKTVEEAQAKYDKYKTMVDWEGGLAKLSGYLNLDLSKYPLDEPLDYNEIKDGAAIEGVGSRMGPTSRKTQSPLPLANLVSGWPSVEAVTCRLEPQI
jgi:alkanesulfonate monooxygenase SsuD/methylene tetrahydromethanopterin reductase-like flavin-dependent oxidoreductase (luciferase family)